MIKLKYRISKVKDNIILIFFACITLIWLVADTITLSNLSLLVERIKRNSPRAIAKQLAVYKTLGGDTDTFDISKNYIMDIETIGKINEEAQNIIESIRLQGHKATPEQKELLIRVINELDNILV